MKAVLLAAGTGSRLRPLTDATPKCLLAFGDRPLLDRWLDALHRAGAGEVLVNLHHRADDVIRHLEGRDGPPPVRTSVEPVLLGSAGTLLANRRWLEHEEMFVVCNSDNLTDFDLRSIVDLHRRELPAASLAVFRADDPSSCGVVELDRRGRVVGFVEKPARPAGNLANAGIYVFHPSVLAELTGDLPLDIGHDLLPKLVGRSVAVEVDGYFRDIGTPESYRRAQLDWLEVDAR